MRARRQNQANEKKPKKREEEEVKDSIIFLTVKDDIKSMMDIGKRPTLIFDEPIVSFDKELVHLYQKVDTVLKPIDLNIVQKENNIREYVITARLRPGEQYQLDVDSAAFVGLYGNHNNKLSKSFSVKKVEEYSNVIVEVSGLKTPAFIEMLDSNDKVVATAPVVDGVAKIMRLNPGTYYMRMILDTNNNGKWDTGNYIEKRQPEEVRYFNQPLNLRANWNVKQEWDIEAVPLIKQKPLAITKNKPKEIERESDKLEREEQERNNSNNMNYGGGTISGN